MKDPSEILQHIKKVDAPPFLLTRIQQKIKDGHHHQIGKLWYRTAFATLIVLFCINIYAIRGIYMETSNETSVFEDMQLTNYHNLYFHE